MKVINYFIAFLLFLSLVNADIYEQEFNINNNEADVLIKINFDDLKYYNFNLNLPEDANNLKVLIDDKEKEVSINDNFAIINGTSRNLTISYSSGEYIENAKKTYFTAEVVSLLDEKLKIRVILPEGAALDKSFKNNLEEASVYPKPGKIETNGKNLIITWNYDAEKNENFPLFVIYNIKNFNYIYLIISLMILIIIISFVIKKNKKIKIKTIKIKDNIEEHLKEEEKLIVNILKQKKGECTQATLVTLTSMSKASLSRLLNELEKRNIIEKEQKGNRNLIILKQR